MTTWDVLDASVRGSAHVQRGLPNQDAIATRVIADGRGAIAAVSDGHGGERYVRSDVGSQLAVEIACDALSRWTIDVQNADAAERELRDRIVPEITAAWRARVQEHLAANPFTDEERARGNAPLDDQPLVSYGATLLVALAAERSLALAQLGDGDILLVRGNDVQLPIEPDARLVASQTTSLCLQTADDDFRCAVLADIENVDLVLMSTDGYANSFANDDWEHEVGRDLRARVTELGTDAVRLQLPAWVGESAQASGDDTSVALLVPRGGAGGADARPVVAGSTRSSSGLARLLVFTVGALAIGLVAGYLWGNASTDTTPSRALPPATISDSTSGGQGGRPAASRATIVAAPGVAVAFDVDPQKPNPTRTGGSYGAIVTRLRTASATWDVTDGGALEVRDGTGPTTTVPVGIQVSGITLAGSSVWAIDAGATTLVPVDVNARTVFPAAAIRTPSNDDQQVTVPSTNAIGG
ncbi:MAG TPA: PP2C family serine/threonine-protein phosphatase [Acidimicrobiia bacterium]|nr:PP2C family serine/threonine-protein phosphatase [Acidimicrobiia bacterium]